MTSAKALRARRYSASPLVSASRNSFPDGDWSVIWLYVVSWVVGPVLATVFHHPTAFPTSPCSSYMFRNTDADLETV
jgi:hypothetical protein